MRHTDLDTGKFLPGNQAGKGCRRPQAAVVYKLKQEMLNCLEPEQIKSIWQRHYELIMDKNPKVALAAIALYYDRYYGKPKESIEMEINQTQTDYKTLPDDVVQRIADMLDQADNPQNVIDVEPLTDDALLILPSPRLSTLKSPSESEPEERR